MFEKIKNLAENISLGQWIIVSVVGIMIASYKVIIGIFLFLGREINLQRNLKRPVLIVKPSDDEISNQQTAFGVPMDMQRETQLLQKSKLFKIEGPITADLVNTSIKDHCLIVLGYCNGMRCLDDVLRVVKEKQLPIIIYTFGNNRASDPKLDEIKMYPWHTFSNFPVRLVSEVYAIQSTFQYDRELSK